MSFANIQIWEIVKWFFVFALVLYGVFAFVIIKQVRVMIRTLDLGFGYLIRLFSYLHMLFVLGLIFLAVLIL